MPAKRRGRSDKSKQAENVNNSSNNSLTAFQRLWCVAHTLGWLNVPELARARRVNSTFLDAVDGGYVAQPFIHLVQTVEQLQAKPSINLSADAKHSKSWLMRRLQALKSKLPFAVNEKMLDRFDFMAKSGDPKPGAFLSSLVKPAVRAADCEALRTIFVELGASKNIDCDVFEYAARDFAVTELLLDLGIVDAQPARTVGFVVNRGGSPALVRRLLESNKNNSSNPEQYKKLGHVFSPHHSNDKDEDEYIDFKPTDGSDCIVRGAYDTIASAAVRRCAFTFRRCRSDSDERKMALENLRMIIDSEREAPWRQEWGREGKSTKHLQHDGQEDLVSPIHLAAANRDYEALEMILNCDFALGGGAGINAPGLAGRYVPAGEQDGGFLTQFARSALEHVCFEWTRFDDWWFCFEDYDDSVDATHILIPVIKLLLRHGAKWTRWRSEIRHVDPRPFFGDMPNPATIVSRDPSQIELLVTLVKEHKCDVNTEADPFWYRKPWYWEGKPCEESRKAQHDPIGETVLHNVVVSGQLAAVKRVVLELRARIDLPFKVVKYCGSRHGKPYIVPEFDSDKEAFLVEEESFYSPLNGYKGMSVKRPREPIQVDHVTGARSVIYDEDNKNENEHRWFLIRVYDLDPTESKEIHAWFRRYCRRHPPRWGGDDADYDEEESD